MSARELPGQGASFPYDHVFSQLQDAILVADAQTGNLVFCNEAAESLLGYEPGDLANLELRRVIPALGSSETSLTPVASVATHSTGEAIPIELSVKTLGQPMGAEHLVAVMRQVARSGRGQVDPLTGLPNRQMFQERLNQAIGQARRHGWVVGVICLDLDRFTLVNETLGMDAGDRLLELVGDRLAKSVRIYDAVARVGADEFLVVLADLADEQALDRTVQRLLNALSPAFALGDQELVMTASVGVSRFPHDGDDGTELVKFATVAKRHAKQNMGSYVLYGKELASGSTPRNLRLMNSLHRAVAREEFFLHFQPQVDLKTGRIIGAEALVRWNSPEFGIVPPLSFISLAEETGLIGPITEWVLQAACKQNKAWQDAGMDPIRIAVNLSARNFRQSNLLEVIADVLERSGLSPHHLELEITENALVADVERTNAMLEKLTASGIDISLDDFGTGYSSLSYLKRFPLVTLKIDRTFVRDIETDHNDAAIVQAIIALAHSLKLKVIAEGVENTAQLDYLIQLGCDQVQGYFFSKPIPADEFLALAMQAQPFVDRYKPIAGA